MSDMASLDQQRARYAWTCVGAAVTGEYVSLAKAAPALIMQNGLMQTLAFYQAKNGTHHSALRDHLCRRIGSHIFHVNDASFDVIMTKLHAATPDRYMMATDEALETLRWIRQYAAARAKVSQHGGAK